MSQEQLLIQTAKRKIKPANCLTIGPESIWSSYIFTPIRAFISQNYLNNLNKLILIAFTFTLLSSGSIWGAVRDISLSTTSLDIGDVAVGGNGTGTFTITNDGGAALQVTSISTDNAEFSVAPSSATLPGGQNQVVTVTFTPGSPGNQSATITIVSNDPDEGTLTVSASGNGVQPLAPEISLSTTSLFLGNLTLGSSKKRTFTITNDGNADLAVSDISSNNGYFSVSPASATIPPAQNQVVTVTLTPSLVGKQNATVTITSNDSDERTLTVSASGNVVQLPAPEITLSTTSVSVGDVTVGSSGTGTFTITNEGDADLVVSSISIDNAEFSSVPSTATIPGAQNQVVTVTFSPSSTGSKSTTITITSNDPDEGTLTVSANGNGSPPPAPEIILSTTSISFGNVTVDTSSILTFTITNEGDADLVVSGINSGNENFSVSPDSATILPGQNQVVTVTFSPNPSYQLYILDGVESGFYDIRRGWGVDQTSSTPNWPSISVGSHNAMITITSNDTDEETLIVLASGKGIEPSDPKIVIILDPSDEMSDTEIENVDIGNVIVGSSVIYTFNIANLGNQDLFVTSISVDNPAFSVAPNSANIAPEETQEVEVTFSPSLAGTQSTTLTVMSNNPDEGTLTFNIIGICIEPPALEITLSATSIDFGDVTVGTSATGTLYITNKGDAVLVIAGISIDNDMFSVSPESATLIAGTILRVEIRFNPELAGIQKANLTITSNDSDKATLAVSVSGNGIEQSVPVIKLSTSSVDLDSVMIGSTGSGIFKITNDGNADLVITDISSDNGSFFVSLNSATINPGQTEIVTVTFKPSESGDHNAEIVIVSNDPDNVELVVRVSCSAVVVGHGSFALSQNSPNPFNPSTTISYSVPDGVTKKITLKIFDLRGRVLRVLVNRVGQPGSYSVVWDGTDKSGRALPSGVYLYRFEAGDFVQIRKMVMVK